jgi:AraC-like DNA-binding protein
MSIDTSILKTWIRENPERASSVKLVAAHFGISVNTLQAEFLRRENMRIGAFILGVRLKAVEEILLTTDKRCFEIAQQFAIREDVLSRWFKQRRGMTMKEFRMKHGSHTPGGGGGGQSLSEDDWILKLQTEIAHRMCI